MGERKKTKRNEMKGNEMKEKGKDSLCDEPEIRISLNQPKSMTLQTAPSILVPKTLASPVSLTSNRSSPQSSRPSKTSLKLSPSSQRSSTDASSIPSLVVSLSGSAKKRSDSGSIPAVSPTGSSISRQKQTSPKHITFSDADTSCRAITYLGDPMLSPIKPVDESHDDILMEDLLGEVSSEENSS